MHIFHKWGKWEETQIKYVDTNYAIGQYQDTVLGQKRTCSICGKVKIKAV